jgi:co-chaperonin GroES (HSP10)
LAVKTRIWIQKEITLSRKDLLASGDAKGFSSVGGFGPGELKPNYSEEVPSVVDNSALFAPKAPAVFYKGTPFNSRVLVRRVELQSNSSIVIPESAKEKSEVGHILAFSKDSKLPEWGLNVGDMILFDRYAAVGQVFPLLNEKGESEPTLLLQDVDIQMKLEEVRNTPEPSVN